MVERLIEFDAKRLAGPRPRRVDLPGPGVGRCLVRRAHREAVAKGASQPWQDTMFELTGTRQMDASAIIDYFKPLQGWLKQQNAGKTCGW